MGKYDPGLKFALKMWAIMFMGCYFFILQGTEWHGTEEIEDPSFYLPAWGVRLIAYLFFIIATGVSAFMGIIGNMFMSRAEDSVINYLLKK